MLVVQSHSSACPEHTRYLQRSQLRSCQAAGTVGPGSPCHLPCEPGAASTTPLGGAPPKTPCTSKQLLWSKARANPAPPRQLSSEPSSSLVLAAWGHSQRDKGWWVAQPHGRHSLMGVTASRVAQPHGWHRHLGRSHQSPMLGDASPRGAGECHSQAPALPCPQDPAGWNLAIPAPLNTGTPSPRTAGADTHSCCLSRLSVKPHLGKGRGR